MFKLFIFLSMFTTFILANTVNFTETKHISALDVEVKKKGTLVFEKEFTKLSYSNNNTSYKFNKEHIVQIVKNKETLLNYEDDLNLTIFSTLLNAIYKEEIDNLKEYFEITKDKEVTILTPNEYIANVIDKIEYKKNTKELEFLRIYFVNEDRIEIVQTK